MEQRILVHTTHYERLTPVCEALQALLFPFYWQHVCVSCFSTVVLGLCVIVEGNGVLAVSMCARRCVRALCGD